MTEEEKIEKYNIEFNKIMSDRPVNNLITCNICYGKGNFITSLNDPMCSNCFNAYKNACPLHCCKKCLGTGYIKNNK